MVYLPATSVSSKRTRSCRTSPLDAVLTNVHYLCGGFSRIARSGFSEFPQLIHTELWIGHWHLPEKYARTDRGQRGSVQQFARAGSARRQAFRGRAVGTLGRHNTTHSPWQNVAPCGKLFSSPAVRRASK